MQRSLSAAASAVLGLFALAFGLQAHCTTSKETPRDADFYQQRQTAGKYYDAQGLYQGRTTDQGKLFDRQGIYQGKIDPNTGVITDRQGRYVGKVKKGK